MFQVSQYSNPIKKPKLLDQVRNALRTKHYSMKTEKAYIHWIKRYILFHNKRHPKEMAEKEISEFLTHLTVQGVGYLILFFKFNLNLLNHCFKNGQILEIIPPPKEKVAVSTQNQAASKLKTDLGFDEAVKGP